MLLLVSSAAIDDRTDGAGARYLQIGRALLPSVRVLVATPGEPPIDVPGVPVVRYSSERSLRTLVDGSTIAVIPASLFDTFPSLGQTATRLVVDLDDRVAVSNTGLRIGDFFLCSTEAEREFWLKVLVQSGRISRRRSRQQGDLRRLIDAVSPGVLSHATVTESDAIDERLHWERIVDPLRLYCTRTSHEPRGTAWTPPAIGTRALRILRQHGARTFVHRSVAHLRRRLHGADLSEDLSPWRRMISAAIQRASGFATVSRFAAADFARQRFRSSLSARRRASQADGLVARLPSVRNLAEFHRLLFTHKVVGPEQRFMDFEIDVSNKCNIRCKMCYFSFDNAFYAKPAYLSPSAFSSFAESVLPHAKAVMLSLGSEPLTSPHFASILRLAARYEVPELGFYTNGLLMNDRVVDAILENGVTLVAVSVDGATKKTFEAIRRGADFDLVLRNVRKLVGRRVESGGSIPRVRFGVVMMQQNIEELADIVTLAWRLGVEELNFFHAVVYEGLDMESQSLVHHKALSNECLARALARAQELGVTIVHNPSPFSLNAPSASIARSRAALRHVPYCRFPFFHVSANANGQVLPCPFSHGEAAFGIVTPEIPFERIWLGSRFNELRRRILTNDPPDMCRRCSFLASSYPDLADLFEARPN